MNLQIGKMYLVKDLFWFLYPTKDLADGAVAGKRTTAYEDAEWYSEYYSCNVVVGEENTCFVLLEQDNIYFKLLNSNGNIGWIRCYGFSKHFELVKE